MTDLDSLRRAAIIGVALALALALAVGIVTGPKIHAGGCGSGSPPPRSG